MMRIKINGRGGNIEIINGNYTDYMRIVFMNTSGTVRNMIPNINIDAEFTEEDIEEKRFKLFSFDHKGEPAHGLAGERYKLFVREDKKYITLNLLMVGLMNNTFLILAALFDKETKKQAFLKIVNPERTQDDIDHERFMNCIGGSSLRRFIHEGVPTIIRQEVIDDIVCNVFTYNGMALYFPGRPNSNDFELYRPYGTFFVVPADDIDIERDARLFLAEKMPVTKQEDYCVFLPTGSIKVGNIIGTERLPAEGYHVYLTKGHHMAEFVFSREEEGLCISFVKMLLALKIDPSLAAYFNNILLSGKDDRFKVFKTKKIKIPAWVMFRNEEISVEVKYFEALQWREATLVKE